jgi:hypothetical protein
MSAASGCFFKLTYSCNLPECLKGDFYNGGRMALSTLILIGLIGCIIAIAVIYSVAKSRYNQKQRRRKIAEAEARLKTLREFKLTFERAAEYHALLNELHVDMTQGLFSSGRSAMQELDLCDKAFGLVVGTRLLRHLDVLRADLIAKRTEFVLGKDDEEWLEEILSLARKIEQKKEDLQKILLESGLSEDEIRYVLENGSPAGITRVIAI